MDDSRELSHRFSGLPPTTGDIIEVFRRLGLRATRPRMLIADRIAELGAAGTEFASEDLWRETKRVDPNIGRATIFRSVDLLFRQGVLDRVPRADGTHRYRVCGPNHHHHVTCTRCQRIVEIDECLSPRLISAIASSTDFAIDGHSLELFGRCPICRGEREGPEGADS